MARGLVKDLSKFHDLNNIIFQKYEPKQNLKISNVWKNKLNCVLAKLLDTDSADNMEKNWTFYS